MVLIVVVRTENRKIERPTLLLSHRVEGEKDGCRGVKRQTRVTIVFAHFHHDANHFRNDGIEHICNGFYLEIPGKRGGYLYEAV